MTRLNLDTLLRRVDLFSLRLFLSTVEEGQIGRAAAREHIAPSAVTKRIQDLEELFGVRLLLRSRLGVTVTTEGEAFARHVRLLLENMEALRFEMNEFSQGVRGHLSISAPSLLIRQFLSDELAKFTVKFPQVQIDLKETSNANAMRTLAAGEVDIAVFVSNGELPYESIESHECRSDRLVGLVPLGHPLSHRKEVAPQELFAADFIGIAPETMLMRDIMKAAAQSGHDLRPKYSVNSVESARSLVRAGLGVTIQPESVLEFDDREGFATVRLTGAWTRRSHHIGTLKGSAPSAAALALIQQLSEHRASNSAHQPPKDKPPLTLTV